MPTEDAIAKRPSVLDSGRQQPQTRYRPILLNSLKNYTRADLRADIVAGIIVGIVALPLSIALAIAVGARPESGLYTAIVGGGLIAALGGSHMQVSGPTAAFIVILAPICADHGELGLMVAGLMAGVILILMGAGRMGSLIKYVPYPVTTGFTTGIAVTIATIQFKDVLGLKVSYEKVTLSQRPMVLGGHEGQFVEAVAKTIPALPDHFHEKLETLWRALFATPPEIILHTGIISALTLAVLIFYPRIFPAAARKVPAPLIGVLVSIAATLGAASLLNWNDIETIGSRFKGGIPRGLPSFNTAMFSQFDWSYTTLQALFMPAVAIAMLGAIESLLSAVVADGMAGTKHDSNAELIGQGIGNIASPLFGGIAATGAIARTATAIRNGARTPVASICHALTLLVIMLAAAPYASYIPMAALGSILLIVAWNMAELKHFRHLLRAPRSDMVVLLTCFLLTVFTDMVIAVAVGMILAALLFMRRMSDITRVDVLDSASTDAEMQSHDLDASDIPRGVLIYSVDGPFFFGASEKAITAIESIGSTTRIVVMRLNRVPAMDATGLYALEKVHEHLKKRKVRLVISGVRAQPRSVMQNAGFLDTVGPENVTPDVEWAMVRCYEILGPDRVQSQKPESQKPESLKV